jgi:hypothetical protein
MKYKDLKFVFGETILNLTKKLIENNDIHDFERALLDLMKYIFCIRSDKFVPKGTSFYCHKFGQNLY